jgi:hypothetical protein
MSTSSTSPAPASVTDTFNDKETTDTGGTDTTKREESKLDSNTEVADKDGSSPAAQGVDESIILQGKKLAVVFSAMLSCIFLIAIEHVSFFPLSFMFSSKYNSNQNAILLPSQPNYPFYCSSSNLVRLFIFLQAGVDLSFLHPRTK